MGVAFSSAQIELARTRHPAIRFELADAEDLPFESDTFDVVVNAFGMCHLPDPELALTEAYRVLKPGGRVGFSVWDHPEHAIGFGAVYSAISEHGDLVTDLPQGPGFFRFSDPKSCIAALQQAGFTASTVKRVPQRWRLSDPDSLYDQITGGTVRAATTLHAQSSRKVKAIRNSLRKVVLGYRRNGRFEIPMPAVLTIGIKP